MLPENLITTVGGRFAIFVLFLQFYGLAMK